MHGTSGLVPIYGLRDDAAIAVNGDTMKLVGSEPLVLGAEIK